MDFFLGIVIQVNQNGNGVDTLVGTSPRVSGCPLLQDISSRMIHDISWETGVMSFYRKRTASLIIRLHRTMLSPGRSWADLPPVITDWGP